MPLASALMGISEVPSHLLHAISSFKNINPVHHELGAILNSIYHCTKRIDATLEY